ncbi:hypothetical protein, partial [Streptomyces sp. NPDC029004]|uniref:hypothetical protein n=1 Tax=Streptomyces sp. NPDC029004 TaxID=3154490 RepID=UPI0033EB4D8C
PVYCRVSGEIRAGLEGRAVSPRAELSVGPAAIGILPLRQQCVRVHAPEMCQSMSPAASAAAWTCWSRYSQVPSADHSLWRS